MVPIEEPLLPGARKWIGSRCLRRLGLAVRIWLWDLGLVCVVILDDALLHGVRLCGSSLL